LNEKSIDPRKLTDLLKLNYPTTGKQVQSYLGTCNFFREFIPNYSSIAAPLDALRNRNNTFTLNETEKQAFDALRNILFNAPILSFPDFTQPFYVATDASNVGIGAVIYRLPRGAKHPETINYISFVSRSL
jgi:hypothetical protein